MNYLGHINAEDNSEQLLKNHLTEVSRLAEIFAEEFGENDAGKIAGLYHDIGKYSQEFQKYIRQENNKKVDHSTAGAQELFNIKSPVNLIAAFCIAGHHGGLQNIGTSKISDETTFFTRMNKEIPNYEKYSTEIENPAAQNNSKLLPAISREIFSVMFYTRMIFSCLVDADFLDTENFMSKGKIRRGNFYNLEELKNIFDNYIEKTFLNENNARYNAPINQKRRQILKECIGKGDNCTENLFSLTVPTGGGKTVSSMAFALHNAVKNGRQKIIYIIPYTSIIEQNAKIFSDILGSENVIEHYGGAESEDDIKKLAAENWDAPIIVTTNVQFFESLFSNRTSKCRKLHNITNSVIIFDEAQMIPTEFLKPCVRAINELTKYYKCTAVLCTATQPSLEKFFDVQTISEICSNVEENYNFFRRTQIKILEEQISAEKLSEQLKNFSQVLCIVNKKKTAEKIFENLQGEENIFYLSTNLCPVHRSKVLQKIKTCLEKNLPCRVISTSLVEAGVDLDFPCVYREIAGLDSIIQAAGRCNREGKFSKDESIVYVFKLSDEKILGTQKIRINSTNLVCEKYFSETDSPQAIKYYFENLHKLDGNKLDKLGILEMHEKKSMPFKEIAEKFKLINENTKSVFIPFDENARQIEKVLLSGEISRALLRRAGKYFVNVYNEIYKKMSAAQKIKLINESLSVLIDLNLYDENTGLNQNIEDGIGIFF